MAACLLLMLAGWNGWQCRQCGAMHEAMVVFCTVCSVVVWASGLKVCFAIKPPAPLCINSLRLLSATILCHSTWTSAGRVPLDVAAIQQWQQLTSSPSADVKHQQQADGVALSFPFET